MKTTKEILNLDEVFDYFCLKNELNSVESLEEQESIENSLREVNKILISKNWYSEEEIRNKLDDIKILYNNGDIGFDEIADILFKEDL